jgi:lysophospholipase L1-like esterase
VLQRDEWIWWPVAPLLLWQGWRALRTVPRLPPPAQPDGHVDGRGPALRLLGLGDSTIAGVGCGHHREALTARTAERLSIALGRAVDWHAYGVSGATAADVRRALLARAVAWRPDAVVLSAGVNDAVRGRSAEDFAADVRAIADAFRPVPVVYAGMAPIGSFPALRPPLATVLGRRARRLEAAATANCGEGVARVVFPSRLEPAAFADDGFHPGPTGCDAWAAWVIDALVPRLR